MEDYGDWIWDESEYNFFMSLGDMAKLEYAYDYFNLDDDEIIGEFEFDDGEYERSNTTSVEVVLTDTHFILTCDLEEMAKKTIATFQMDGHIMLFERRRGDTYFYRYVGMTPPLSVN
jgi:hypothetical protein